MNIRIEATPDGRMTRTGAAAYLGLSRQTLAAYATRGAGPKFIKPGGRVWYRKTDLDAWLAEGEATSTAQARVKKEGASNG